MKKYTQAPLPFQGQKRRFLTPFKEALNSFSPTATYVDLFGGSGLLSHTVKQYYPDANVIYNDFDNYSQRLDNVEKTNNIIGDLREILKDYPDAKRIVGDVRYQVIDRLKQEKGFVDFITISSSLCFSMNYGTTLEHFEKDSLYNNVRQSNYKCDGYLEGVNRVKKDYRDLFAEYRNHNNVVFLVDPPYLSTDTTTYNRTDYWKLTDYLNVLKVIEDTSYFYFTSNKSQIIELCDWMENNGYCKNPFDDSTTVTIGAQLTHNAKYNDIMIYKNND
jgi:16S rRNA G966 N2-methylase RsmD